MTFLLQVSFAIVYVHPLVLLQPGMGTHEAAMRIIAYILLSRQRQERSENKALVAWVLLLGDKSFSDAALTWPSVKEARRFHTVQDKLRALGWEGDQTFYREVWADPMHGMPLYARLRLPCSTMMLRAELDSKGWRDIVRNARKHRGMFDISIMKPLVFYGDTATVANADKFFFELTDAENVATFEFTSRPREVEGPVPASIANFIGPESSIDICHTADATRFTMVLIGHIRNVWETLATWRPRRQIAWLSPESCALSFGSPIRVRGRYKLKRVRGRPRKWRIVARRGSPGALDS